MEIEWQDIESRAHQNLYTRKKGPDKEKDDDDGDGDGNDDDHDDDDEE